MLNRSLALNSTDSCHSRLFAPRCRRRRLLLFLALALAILSSWCIQRSPTSFIELPVSAPHSFSLIIISSHQNTHRIASVHYFNIKDVTLAVSSAHNNQDLHVAERDNLGSKLALFPFFLFQFNWVNGRNRAQAYGESARQREMRRKGEISRVLSLEWSCRITVVCSIERP